MQILRQEGNSIITTEKEVTDGTLWLFDVDGTVTWSKSPVTPVMAGLLRDLLKTRGVVLLGGGTYGQLREQCADHITDGGSLRFSHPFVLAPLSGNSIHTYAAGVWETRYEGPVFGDAEVARITGAIHAALNAVGYTPPETTYGEVIENRGGQVTFSALGQEAPPEEKEKWSAASGGVRLALREELQRRLPDLVVRAGGSTSVDVSRGDKGSGVERIAAVLDIPVGSMLFFGDQLHTHGNDYPVFRTGIDAVSVADPDDTARSIGEIAGR